MLGLRMVTNHINAGQNIDLLVKPAFPQLKDDLSSLVSLLNFRNTQWVILIHDLSDTEDEYLFSMNIKSLLIMNL